MTQALTHGLPAAVFAAALYGCPPVLQAAAVRRTAPGAGLGLRLLPQLAVQPLWLLGTACGIAAFVVEAYAFSVAPAALVAPLITLDIVFLALLARRGLSERLGVRGSLGIAAMVLGTALIGFGFSGDAELGAPASHVQLVAFMVGGTVAAGAAALVGDRGSRTGRSWLAAIGFGLASGIAAGIATLTTRQIGLTFDVHDPWPILDTPTPYMLLVASILALALLQRGLQSGASVLTFPVMSFMSAFIPVMVGITALNDQVPTKWQGVAFVVALLAVAIGLALLARDRAAAENSIERTDLRVGETA
jgi:drug/metabolite transporter (DMT)-like permease